MTANGRTGRLSTPYRNRCKSALRLALGGVQCQPAGGAFLRHVSPALGVGRGFARACPRRYCPMPNSLDDAFDADSDIADAVAALTALPRYSANPGLRRWL